MVRPMLVGCRETIESIALLIPPYQFWRCIPCVIFVQLCHKLISFLRQDGKIYGNDRQCTFILLPSFYFTAVGRQVTSAVFSAALVEYLSNGKLLGLPEASEILGSMPSLGSLLTELIKPRNSQGRLER